MNDELWLHPVKWWPFYWYSQAKCHYLYSKTGATNFSEAMFAPSWLLTSRLQTYKRISVAGYDIEDCMTSLYLSILGMLSLSPHQTPQQTAKHINKQLIIKKWPLYALSALQQASVLYYCSNIYVWFTWCTRNANLTPWTMSSSSSGPPPPLVSSSPETLFMYFMANFTDASFICHNITLQVQKQNWIEPTNICEFTLSFFTMWR